MKKNLLFSFFLLLGMSSFGQLVISSNTTWSGSMFLSQKVIVKPGATLTIEPATNIIIGYVDSNGDNIGDVEIEVNGKLNAKGNIACSPVIFGPLTTTSNYKYWKGIKINSNEVNDSIVGVNIFNAEMPFNVLSNATIKECNIRLFDNTGINFTPADSNVVLNLQAISIKKGKTAMYQSNTTSRVKADWIEIDSCLNAIIGNTGEFELKSSKVLNSKRLGVAFNDGKLTVLNSRIEKNYAFGIFNSSGHLFVQNCEVDSNFLGGVLISGIGNNIIQNSNIKYNLGAQIEISDYKFDLTQVGTIRSPYDGHPLIKVNNNNIIGDTLNSILDTAGLFHLDNRNPPCGFNGSSGYITEGFGFYDVFTVLGKMSGVYFSYSDLKTFGGGYLKFYDSQNTFYDIYVPATAPNKSFSGWLNATSNTLQKKTIKFERANYPSFIQCGVPTGNWVIKWNVNSYALRAQYHFGGDLIFNNIRTAVSTPFDFTSNNFAQPILTNFFFDESNQNINYSNYTIFNIANAGLKHGQQLINSTTSNLVYLATSSGRDTFCTPTNFLSVSPVVGATYNWYLNGNLFTSTAQNTYRPPVSGSWHCVVNSLGCNFITTARSIVLSNGPLVTISGQKTICKGQTTTLTATGAKYYRWSDGTANSNLTLSPASSQIITITGTSNGCSSTQVVSVTVNPLPTITISPFPSAIVCPGSSVAMSATGASTYSWSNGSSGNSISISSAGVYSVTGTDNNGCSGVSPKTTIVLTNNVPPTPTISANGALTFCQGGKVTLTSSSSTGNIWSNGETSQSISVSVGGSYTVSVSNGICSSTSTPVVVAVTSNPQSPIITAIGNTTFCKGSQVTLTSNSAGVIWSNGATTQSITVSQPGNYTAQSKNNGCLSPPSNQITIIESMPPDIPQITTSGSTNLCGTQTVTLTSSSSANNIWSNNATSQSITVSSAGNYSVTVANANGCTASSQTVTVTVNPIPNAPVISANGPTTFCSGGSVTLTSSSPNGNLWNNNFDASSIIVNSTGSYSATVNQNGCVSPPSNIINVVVNPIPNQPVVTINGPITFCFGDSIKLISSSAIGNVWNTLETSQTIYVRNSGTYSVKVVVNGCSSNSTPVDIKINPTPPAPTIIASGPTTFCQGSNVILSTNAAGNVLWTLSNGVQFQGPTLIVQNNQQNIYARVTQNGCTSPPSQPVNTIVLPVITPTFNQVQPVCFREAFTLPSTSNNGISGSWSPAINNTSTTTYVFTPSAGQCASTQSMTVKIEPLPVVTLPPFNAVCDTAGMIKLTGGNPLGGLYSGSSVNNDFFNTIVGVGTYPITYKFTNSNGCSNTAIQNLRVIKCIKTAVIEIAENGVVLYPNPTSDTFTVETSEDLNGKSFIIRDATGRTVSTGNLSGNKAVIAVSQLTPGTYYCILPELNKTMKFIKH